MGNKQVIASMPGEDEDGKKRFKSFPGSAILEKAICGAIDTTDPAEYQETGTVARLLHRAEVMCVSSPMSTTSNRKDFFSGDDEENSIKDDGKSNNRRSAKLLAKALVSEVTDNPKTMKQAEMENREKKLLRAQKAASQGDGKPVGAAGPPNVLRSMAFACTGDDVLPVCDAEYMQDDPEDVDESRNVPASPYQVTIGISLSRRHPGGHAATITRQTVYDFNELQDRSYKYVSATDSTGWRAGGGEPSGEAENDKLASPDIVHIPIIKIDCPNAASVDSVITALASGEIFIPHMSVLPEALTVDGVSPPDLVVKFGCERNEDLPPDEWPNWCLEFIHNQLYDYFYSSGARWTKRNFQITLARKVRWKTVKHMNRYFANAEKVMEAWREKGPQYLDPVVSHLEGGASREEVARPHGIYMFRNGMPTNYFPPNFDPPYTTKMTRSLLSNVLGKSWDQKRREWSSRPLPRVVAPSALVAAACGCTDGSDTNGFVASKATAASPVYQQTHSPAREAVEKPTEPAALSEVEFDISGSGHTEEEKKSDDRNRGRYATAEEDVMRSKRSNRYSIASDDNAKSVTQSTFHSVAESGTTVMHGNLTKNSSFKSPLSTSSPRLFSDEDFVGMEGASPTLKKMQWQQPTKQMDENQAPATPTYSMQADSPRNKPVEQNLSAASLEYSTDGSSALFAPDVSLLGQHFAPAKPSKSPKESRIGRVESTVLSGGSSVHSVIPSDADLYAIGWAKAKDAASGDYYYFTLDRTQTAWENPLSILRKGGPQKASIDP